MKLHEFAFKVNNNLEFSDDQIKIIQQEILEHGKFFQFVENQKFFLYDLEGKRFALFSKDKKLQGFIDYSRLENDILKVDRIFVIKEFRNLRIGTILLFWFKNAYHKSVFLGSPIFKDGQEFVKSIAKNGSFDLSLYNIRTKEKSEFSVDKFFDGKQFTGMLIETWENTDSWNNGFHIVYSPLSENEKIGVNNITQIICLELFNGVPEEIIEF